MILSEIGHVGDTALNVVDIYDERVGRATLEATYFFRKQVTMVTFHDYEPPIVMLDAANSEFRDRKMAQQIAEIAINYCLKLQ